MSSKSEENKKLINKGDKVGKKNTKKNEIEQKNNDTEE